MLKLEQAFAQFPHLSTARLELRAFAASDAAQVFRIKSDPLVMRYFGELPMATAAEADQWVADTQQAFHDRRGIRWAIVNRADGQLIGSGGFWRLIDAHARAEIGYELNPAWWGKGIMPEALTPMITFGFAVLGLHTIEAQIHPANTGSRRVLEKLGFVQEGYFRQNFYDPNESGFSDTAVFSLLHADWRMRSTTSANG
ncbi:MAG: GNAT family N-acetyltransferase [Roseiflexaceae bacterium]